VRFHSQPLNPDVFELRTHSVHCKGRPTTHRPELTQRRPTLAAGRA
jgi:hypothetical protein